MDNLSLFFLIFGVSSKNNILDFVMIFGAEYLIYLVFILMFFFSVKGGLKEKKSFLLSLLCLPIVIIIIKLIHLFFFEPRPFVSYQILPLISHQADASFPSRHTSIMAAIAFSYTYYKSKWSPLFLLALLWVGISRIYAGVHYPQDILGGIAVGIITLLIALQIKKMIKVKFL